VAFSCRICLGLGTVCILFAVGNGVIETNLVFICIRSAKKYIEYCCCLEIDPHASHLPSRFRLILTYTIIYVEGGWMEVIVYAILGGMSPRQLPQLAA
jgi:hypothetical protein